MKIINIILILVFSITPVFSETLTYCLSDIILQKNTTKNLIVDNEITQFIISENITCAYNCSNSTLYDAICNPQPFKSDLLIGGGIILLFIVIYFILTKLK